MGSFTGCQIAAAGIWQDIPNLEEQPEPGKYLQQGYVSNRAVLVEGKCYVRFHSQTFASVSYTDSISTFIYLLQSFAGFFGKKKYSGGGMPNK